MKHEWTTTIQKMFNISSNQGNDTVRFKITPVGMIMIKNTIINAGQTVERKKTCALLEAL